MTTFFQTFSLCYSTWSLSASGNTFFLKKWFYDLTISSKQNGFIHFQSSSKTVLHAHFFIVTALFLFHVFQHCNVTLLVFLFLLLIRTKFKVYKLDPVMEKNSAQAHCFLFCCYYCSNPIYLKVFHKVLLPRTQHKSKRRQLLLTKKEICHFLSNI